VANFQRRAVKKACLQADAFLAYSPAVRRELEAAGYPREKIHDICLGIGPVGSPGGKTRSQARNDLGEENGPLFLAPNTQLAICTTRLNVDAGWQSLIDAWPSVIKACPAARLWLISEPACRKAVLDHISALKLEGHVQVIGAMDSLEAIVAAANVLIAPSPHGSQMAILEALAAGLPVVAADTSVNRWLLNVSGTLRVPLGDSKRSVPSTLAGLLVPPGDTRQMAEAIITLLNSPEPAEELGMAGWQKASRDFSLAKMLDDHITLFQGLLGRPQAQAPE
jgi:glycosyltransferase involved in cell wall biosynthesis